MVYYEDKNGNIVKGIDWGIVKVIACILFLALCCFLLSLKDPQKQSEIYEATEEEIGYSNGYEDGYADGYAEGYAAASAEK